MGTGGRSKNIMIPDEKYYILLIFKSKEGQTQQYLGNEEPLNLKLHLCQLPGTRCSLIQVIMLYLKMTELENSQKGQWHINK